MNSFDTEQHTIKLSDDGSFTAYSKEYSEHYHSTRDGALHESLTKHVIPALEAKKNQNEICILDICFGLGFNTLATLYYAKEKRIESKIHIHSPELDKVLVKSLLDFQYPLEFESMRHIIEELVQKGSYQDEQFYIELYLGDARDYVKKFKSQTFDVVYQDAFSPAVNPSLWTKEYFADIRKCIKDEGILTSYSTALKTRLALYENDFYIYINSGKDFRNASIASPKLLEGFSQVDMQHKIMCNPDIQSLRD